MDTPTCTSPRNRFLTPTPKSRAVLHFASGILTGGILCLVVLRLSGLAVVSQQELDQQAQRIAELEEENVELTDDLFTYRGPDSVFDPADLPYDESADARAVVAEARQQALQEGKFLMITFGANWCIDCRTLHRTLRSREVMAYTGELFHFANVDVGKFNRNRDVASELGVELKLGIPVAVFFDATGNMIGTTNDGQLETARFYSSKQILGFVRDVAEHSRITAPDSIR